MPTMNPSAQIVRDAVQAAIKNGRSFHDYWYYTMSFTDHALFAGKQEFEARADAVYKRELERAGGTSLPEAYIRCNLALNRTVRGGLAE